MALGICSVLGDNCQPNWDAVGSLSASCVAVWLAVREILIRRSDRKSIVREACSTGDQLSAYQKAARSIMQAPIVYHPQLAGLRQIRSNCSTLANVAKTLLQKSDLTDGCISVLARGVEISEVLRDALAPHDESTQALQVAKSKVESLDLVVRQLDDRSARVRTHHSLKSSATALAITEKYSAIVQSCAAAAVNQTGPDIEDPANTPY